jgi:hypothetical protein
VTLDIHFGYDEQGQAVSIPLFQTFFNATTGHGKTVGMKTLLWRFHQAYPDWKILIIDSKDKRDYADFNADIPICFVETTEPLDLKNLLEPLVGSSMMYYLDKIIEEAIFDTLDEMQQNIERKIQDADEGKIKIHGKELGKLRVLNHLLKKLVVLVDRPEITSELVLRPGLNVMPVSLAGVPGRLKRAFQWLIVRSVMLKLTEPEFEKVLVVLDEFHKWSPQRWASICKQPISENVAEGRGKEIFYWMADQALAKVDKEPLKPVKVWIVGQQLGRHEVKYAVETVNDMTELTMDKKDIKRLRVGFFVIVDGVHHEVKRAYLHACGVPDELAVAIATGKQSPLDAEPYIQNFKFHVKIEEDEDMVFKEKWLEEKRKREELEKDFADIRTRIFNEVNAEFEEKVKALREQNEEMRKANLDRYHGELKEANKKLESLELQVKDTERMKLDFVELKKLKDAFISLVLPEILEALKNLDVFGEWLKMGVQGSPTALTIAEIDERITQRLSESKEITIVKVDIDQRIKELVKNSYVENLVGKIKVLSAPAVKAALWLRERKSAKISELYYYMHEKTGRIPGNFYTNVIKPLERAWLIVNDSGSLRWILQEKLSNVLKDGDVQEIAKYLTSLLL